MEMTGRRGRKRVLIMGAGGRDFHDFNLLFRDDPDTEVVAFTAAQIPFLAGRSYPPSLSGPLYPEGIPVFDEGALPALITDGRVDEVLLAYSDLSHQRVMEIASEVLALGADFRLAGPERTMLQAAVPVVAVCAVRTGCGKSPVTRYLVGQLLKAGRRPVVVRHPMAYGRLDIRGVELFREPADLDRYQCTLEEREEFEPWIAMGVTLFAGIDYGAILRLAELEGDLILWDGGNNDLPFFRPDLHIVLVDPFRAGDEATFYPGLVNLRRADLVVLAKSEGAPPGSIGTIRASLDRFNPRAAVAEGSLVVQVDDPGRLKGRRVVVVEDGPTVTHGGMAFGAATVAARIHGATIVDPRPFATGSLATVYRDYPHLEGVVPAMGYSEEQLGDLRETLEGTPCDLILSGTPADLGGILGLRRPVLRVGYEFREAGEPLLARALMKMLARGGVS